MKKLKFCIAFISISALLLISTFVVLGNKLKEEKENPQSEPRIRNRKKRQTDPKSKVYSPSSSKIDCVEYIDSRKNLIIKDEVFCIISNSHFYELNTIQIKGNLAI